MKSSVQRLTVIIILLVAGMPLSAKGNPGFTTISGSVKDQKSKKNLEYVNICVSGTSIGTVTNADGYFNIKITDSIKAHDIEISYLGYHNEYILLKGEDMEDVTVYLRPNINTLPEIVVHAINPLNLVKQAVDKIEVNNSDDPNNLTGFYRETVRKRRNYINVTEAVVDIYKTSYKENVLKDRVQVLKGRQLVSTNRGDTLIVKLQGGPYLSVFLDVVKNRELLFDEQAFLDYKFIMEGYTMLDERPHYVVSFMPKAVQPYPLFYGKLYINELNLAFTQAEFNYNMKDRNKITHHILKKKPLNLRFKPEEITYLVRYKQENGRTYLNYMRNEIKFKCDWKRKLFSTNYAVLSEMVVTDKVLENAEIIPIKQAFDGTSILSDKVGSFYDEDFWEGYNIIAPTESLETAVNRLRKNYQ